MQTVVRQTDLARPDLTVNSRTYWCTTGMFLYVFDIKYITNYFFSSMVPCVWCISLRPTGVGGFMDAYMEPVICLWDGGGACSFLSYKDIK